jgi:hypothetical protein
MILKQGIKSSQIVVRCINIIKKESDPKFGLTCEQRLIHKNSQGQVAGEIKCRRCGALYEIINDELCLIKRGD